MICGLVTMLWDISLFPDVHFHPPLPIPNSRSHSLPQLTSRCKQTTSFSVLVCHFLRFYCTTLFGCVFPCIISFSTCACSLYLPSYHWQILSFLHSLHHHQHNIIICVLFSPSPIPSTSLDNSGTVFPLLSPQ